MSAWVNRKYLFGVLLALTFAGHYAAYNLPWRLNSGASPAPEWPLLVDLLVTLPLLYYLLHRPTLRQLLLKCAGILMLGILFGMYAIPESSKSLWHTLENARTMLAIPLVLAELTLLGFVAFKLAGLLRLSGDADRVIDETIAARLGDGAMARLAVFEARVWYYALFLRHPERLRYAGTRHFSYAAHQGNASNQLAWIMLIGFEMPLTHVLLHFVATPTVALVVSGLTLWSLLYLVADYRASHHRPVSLGAEALLVRCGVLSADAVIAYAMLADVRLCDDAVRRQRGVRRYRQMGALNVRIDLQPGSQLADFFGRPQTLERIYLSLDDGPGFVAAVTALAPALRAPLPSRA